MTIQHRKNRSFVVKRLNRSIPEHWEYLDQHKNWTPEVLTAKVWTNRYSALKESTRHTQSVVAQLFHELTGYIYEHQRVKRDIE